MNKTAVLNELMNVQHRKALLQTEMDQLDEKEKFLTQEHKLMSGMTTENDAPKKSTAKPATNKKAAPVVDEDEDLESSDDTEIEDEDDIPVTKSKKKSAALDLDEDEEEAPKKSAKPAAKKGAKASAEELEETSDDDDLDDFLGTSPDKTETAPKIGADEVRKLLSTIVREKGEKGKAAARKVMVKYTKGGSAQVKDMLAGSHHKAYAALQKI